MRWKGLIFLGVVIAVFVVLSLIFTDIWLENKLERTGTTIVGAKVQFDNVDFSFTGLHMRWDSLQVTNPKNTMKNIFTTGPTGFDMRLAPLFSQKVIIENIQMTNVTSGTDRTTDGKIEQKRKEKKSTFLTKTILRLQEKLSEAPAWNLDDYAQKVNVDSILKILNVQSPEKIDSLQNSLVESYQNWSEQLDRKRWQNKFNEIEEKVKSLEPEEIKDISSLQNSVQTVQQLQKTLDSLQTSIKTMSDSLQGDLNTYKTKISLVDNWIRNDVQRALAKAKLPSLDKQNIALFLFGQKVVSQAAAVLGTVNTVRSYNSRLQGEPKKQSPPRLKGQNIHFVKQQVWPTFWIKNIELSGHTTRGLALGGQVKNIVSQQKVIGEPTTFQIRGSRADQAALQLEALFNYLGDGPKEKFSLSVERMPLTDVELRQAAFLPTIQQGRGALNATMDIRENQLEGSLSFKSHNVSFSFDETEPDNLIEQRIQRVFNTTTAITVNASLFSATEKTDFSLDSNFDDLLVEQMTKVLGEDLKEARQKIENTVRERVSAHRQNIEQLITERTAKLQREMKEYTDMLDDQKKLIEEKEEELKERIEEEKKKAGKEVKDRLKGLFD